MEKIHSQVYRIPVPFVGDFETQTYLILGRQTVLIDSGTASTIRQHLIPALSALDMGIRDIDLIINTHCHPDHAGGNQAVLKDVQRAKVMIHKDDEPLSHGLDAVLSNPYDMSALMRKIGRDDLVNQRRQFLSHHLGDIKVDRWMTDREEIDLGRGIVLKVIHAPGHTPGAVVLYWEREGIAFSGDALQGRGVFPGEMPLYFNAADYMNSATKMKELPLSILCMGHGFQTAGPFNLPVRKGRSVKQTVDETLDVSVRIDEAVAENLKTSDSSDLIGFTRAVLTSLQDDLPIIGHRDIGAPVSSLAAVFAHLERLANTG